MKKYVYILPFIFLLLITSVFALNNEYEFTAVKNSKFNITSINEFDSTHIIVEKYNNSQFGDASIDSNILTKIRISSGTESPLYTGYGNIYPTGHISGLLPKSNGEFHKSFFKNGNLESYIGYTGGVGTLYTGYVFNNNLLDTFYISNRSVSKKYATSSGLTGVLYNLQNRGLYYNSLTPTYAIMEFKPLFNPVPAQEPNNGNYGRASTKSNTEYCGGGITPSGVADYCYYNNYCSGTCTNEFSGISTQLGYYENDFNFYAQSYYHYSANSNTAYSGIQDEISNPRLDVVWNTNYKTNTTQVLGNRGILLSPSDKRLIELYNDGLYNHSTINYTTGAHGTQYNNVSTYQYLLGFSDTSINFRKAYYSSDLSFVIGITNTTLKSNNNLFNVTREINSTLGYYNVSTNNKIKKLGNINTDMFDYSTSPTCQLGILNLSNINLRAVACKDSQECYIGGTYNDGLQRGLLFSVNTITHTCSLPLMTTNLENTTINDIEFVEDTNKFYVGGNNLLLSFQSTTSPNGTLLPICVDNNYVCTNPSYSGGSYYCNIYDEQYCEQGCMNFVTDTTTNTNYESTFNNCNTIYSTQSTKQFSCTNIPLSVFGNIFTQYGVDCSISTNYITTTSANCNNNNINEIINNYPQHNYTSFGICSTDSTCTNECNIAGQTICDSTTSYAVCGNYDADSCLEYSGGYGCTSGNVCSNGFCVSNTGIGLTNNTAFSVTPYSISSTSTSYTLDAQNKKITISSTLPYHIQEFSIATTDPTTYSSRQCNYQESSIYNNLNTENVNTTLTKSFNSLGTAGYVEVSVLPKHEIPTTIIFKDSIGNQITNYTLIRNSTIKELCVYEKNNSVSTYCDYSINNYDDLSSVNLRTDYNFDTDTYTATILFNRLQDNTRSVQPKSFTQLDVSSIDIVSTDATYYSTYVKSYNVPTAFSITSRQDYNYLRCTYSSNGCRVVRTYNNNNGIADNTNYYDYQVCIGALNVNSVTTTTSVNQLPELSAGAKIFIILAVVMIVIIGFSIGGYAMGNPFIGMVVGATLGLFTLIVSSIPDAPFIGGFTPVWVVILIALFIILIGSFLLVRKTQGGNAVG